MVTTLSLSSFSGSSSSSGSTLYSDEEHPYHGS
jgi:hypothetical protein